MFDFGVGVSKIISEAKWYKSGAGSAGTWKWQGSNNGSAWTDIGSTFTLGGSTLQVQTQLNGNTTAHRYYRLLGMSGGAYSGDYTNEVEFCIGDAATAFISPLPCFIPGL